MAIVSYRLGDADRERLDAPEWLPLDLLSCTLDDVTELSDQHGFELEDWPDVILGPTDGKPPKWAFKAVLWLALHQNGVAATWDDVGRIEVLRVTRRRDDDQGKDPASGESPPPPTPATSTTPPSSTSSPD